MVWVNDIYRPYLARGREDAHYLRTSRLASLAMAMLMAAGAWLLYQSSAATIMEMSIILLALVGVGFRGRSCSAFSRDRVMRAACSRGSR
jgi:Na+/proline symporter